MQPRFGIITLLIAQALAPSVLLAQGALSTQGFGFPTGQLSTRTRATGGGLSEFDPDTPRNPAAISLASEARMYFQYEPEFRRLANGSAAANTLTPRFPLLALTVPLRSRANVGVSVASFLDRSTSTSSSTQVDVAGQLVTVDQATRITGAINDIRLAAAWAPSSRFQAGVGGHVFSGQNRVFFSQSFPDAAKFNSVSQVSTLGFTGFAASAGILVKPSSILGIGLSARRGFEIEARNGDSAVSRANVPDRYSAGVSYEGIPGSSISAHVARETWSSLNGLGSAAVTAVDTWAGGVGIEAVGPRLIQRQTILRLGARYRTLPFMAAGSEVRELAFGGGIGAQFFRNRASFDIAMERAGRTLDQSDADLSERGFTLSFGLRVRP